MAEPRADQPGAALAVTTTSQQLLAADPARQIIVLSNDSDTVIWARIDGGPVVAGQGIRLNPAGGQLVLEYAGPVSAIHANLNATGAATTGATKSLAYSIV